MREELATQHYTSTHNTEVVRYFEAKHEIIRNQTTKGFYSLSIGFRLGHIIGYPGHKQQLSSYTMSRHTAKQTASKYGNFPQLVHHTIQSKRNRTSSIRNYDTKSDANTQTCSTTCTVHVLRVRACVHYHRRYFTHKYSTHARQLRMQLRDVCC